MFVFVFYFQGARATTRSRPGIKLAPMAIGMLIASPLAGIWADRRGSRTLAALGHARDRRRRWPAMTTLEVDTPVLAEPRSGCSSSASGRACSTRPTPPR